MFITSGFIIKNNTSMSKQEKLKNKILELVQAYAEDYLTNHQPFDKGNDFVQPAGKLLGSQEFILMTEAVLDGWLTTGRFNEQFERKLGEYLDVKHVLTTNSGSSANLLAISALTSPKLGGRRLIKGDEIITVAAGFPTTVNPILQNACVPVFVDINLSTYNVNEDLIESVISNKTKAIILSHTLGNPFNIECVQRIASKYNLWLVEDCCDALGSEYRGKKVGGFGDIGTLSFYPAHHITMGEGGAVFTNNTKLKRIIESFRDWGRDCYCAPGHDNTCKKRFSKQLGKLPVGYDHKYIYSHIGYNLKITDIQAACGLAQLNNIDCFTKKRRENFSLLNGLLVSLDSFFYFPKSEKDSLPSWFGYPITIKEEAGFSRLELIKYLDEHKVGTRLLFAGNIIRQPYFEKINYRSGSLDNTDYIMKNTFWLGVHPALNEEHLHYIADKLIDFCCNYKK